MKLDIREVLKEKGSRLSRSFDERLDDSLGVAWKSPVRGTVTVSHTGSHVVVRGEFASTAELECGRCLMAFDFPVETELEAECPLSFFRKVERNRAREEDVGEDLDEAELAELFDQDSLNVGELCREAALLQFPLQPLCSPSCKGLCPQCGKDRNTEGCLCGP